MSGNDGSGGLWTEHGFGFMSLKVPGATLYRQHQHLCWMVPDAPPPCDLSSILRGAKTWEGYAVENWYELGNAPIVVECDVPPYLAPVKVIVISNT